MDSGQGRNRGKEGGERKVRLGKSESGRKEEGTGKGTPGRKEGVMGTKGTRGSSNIQKRQSLCHPQYNAVFYINLVLGGA